MNTSTLKTMTLGRPSGPVGFFEGRSPFDWLFALAVIGGGVFAFSHYAGAMEDYQHGHMSGADNNIEGLTGRRPMTVGEFAKAHLDQLNTCPLQ